MYLFADEGEVCLTGVVLEEVLERCADGAFVLFAKPFIRFEFGVVLFDGFVRGFDVEHDLLRQLDYNAHASDEDVGECADETPIDLKLFLNFQNIPGIEKNLLRCCVFRGIRHQ